MIPDFAKYSLEQLKEIERNIKREKYPENYAALQAELDKRRSTPEFIAGQRKLEAERHRWVNKKLTHLDKNYRNSLLATVSLLFLINLIGLFQGSYLALIPLSLQSAILYTVLKGYHEQIILIRIWSGLLITVGFLYLVADSCSMVSNSLDNTNGLFQDINAARFFYACACLGFGVYYFLRLGKSIVPTTEDLS
jgi:hypothetical protein